MELMDPIILKDELTLQHRARMLRPIFHISNDFILADLIIMKESCRANLASSL